MDNDPDLIAACTKAIPRSARSDRTKRKKKKRSRPVSTFMSILHKFHPSKSKKSEPDVAAGVFTSEADSCNVGSERHIPQNTRSFQLESTSGPSEFTSSAACESSSCTTRESTSMASVQELAPIHSPIRVDQDRIDRTQNLVDAVSIQAGLRSGLSSSWSYFIQDPPNGQSEKSMFENEFETYKSHDMSFNESYFEDDYCQDFSDPDVFFSRSDADTQQAKSHNVTKGVHSARNRRARRSKKSSKKQASISSAPKQQPSSSLPVIVVTPPSQTPVTSSTEYDNIEDYFSFSFEKVKTSRGRLTSKSTGGHQNKSPECNTPSRMKFDRGAQIPGKFLFASEKRKHSRKFGSESCVSEQNEKEFLAEKNKRNMSPLRSPVSQVPKIQPQNGSTRESFCFSRPGLRNRRQTFMNKLGELRVPGSYRGRVESGYASSVNPLTPSTPATPGVNSTHSPTVGGWSISSALSSLSNGTSTRVLNRIDGLTTPCRPTRGFNASPCFKFPPVKKDPDLKALAESRESSPSLSVVDTSPVSSEGHISHEKAFKDESVFKDDNRHQKNSVIGSATDSGNGTFTSRGNSPTAPVDENNNYIEQVGGAAVPNTAVKAGKASLEIPLPVLTSSPTKEQSRAPMEVDSNKSSHTLRREKRKSNAFKGKTFKRTKRMLFENGESEMKACNVEKSLHQNLNKNLNRNCPDQASSRDATKMRSNMDYLLLKRTGDFIVDRITIYEDIKKYIKMTRLVEYLFDFYHRILARPGFESARSITELRRFHAERQDVFRVERLTAETCIEELLISTLLNHHDSTASCIKFIFKNIHSVVAVNADFLTAAPEVVLMLLSHKDSPVLNVQGFPLPYKESEREVLRAAVKYLDYNKARKGLVGRHLRKMLSFVSDPQTQLDRDSGNLASSPSDFSDDDAEMLRRGIKLEKNYLRRPFHEINFYRSEKYVTAKDSRQEYLFQPFLSTKFGSGRQRTRSECDLKLNNDDVDHDDDDCDGDGNNPAVLSSFRNDLSDVSDGIHVLQKLYFSYRRHNQVPYITHIALQYSSRGRKRMIHMGCPNTKPASPSYSRDVSSDTPSGFRGSPTKTVEVKLATGEHVIGLAVQGDAVLHNVEVHTSRHRHIRAHVLPDVTNVPWTIIPPPPYDGPFCLHAVFGDVKRPLERPYIRGFGVVWSVMSLPMNNLNS